MKEKDRRTVETIISYCDRLNDHIAACDNNKENMAMMQPMFQLHLKS